MEDIKTTMGSSVPERRPKPAKRETTPTTSGAVVASYSKGADVGISNAVNPFVAWGSIIGVLAIAVIWACLAWF